jgi:hypothetical protein
MTGRRVAWKCAVACLFGESSQQPTRPQVRQMQPLAAAFQAFLAAERARRDVPDASDMTAAFGHHLAIA